MGRPTKLTKMLESIKLEDFHPVPFKPVKLTRKPRRSILRNRKVK